MKKGMLILLAILFSGFIIADEIEDHNYISLAKEIIKPLPKNLDDRLRTDDSIVRDATIKQVQINTLQNQYPELFLTDKDISPDCTNISQSYDFLTSKRINDVQEIENSFVSTDNDTTYYVKFRIFKDKDRAIMGLNEHLASFSRKLKLENTKGSKTGNRFGNMTLWTSDMDTANLLGMIVLYKNLYADIKIVSGNPLPPSLMDQWAENALNRMKLALGEKVEPIKSP